MKGSYRIAKVSGIEVRVHVTFFLLLAFYGWIFFEKQGLAGAVSGLTLIVLLFLCVLLHEFGHAFAARRYGIRTPDITLLPIGGLARLERMPDSPWQELVIAVAGPAVNVVIAALIALGLGRIPDAVGIWRGVESGGLLDMLFYLNVMLIAFNMLPAFPMDGGRVLRSLLAMRLPHTQATRIAARIGQGVALVFVGVAIMIPGYMMLLLIAFFVFMGAQQELAQSQMRTTLNSLRVGDAMNTSFRALPANLVVGDLGTRLAGNAQEVFPLVDDALHLHGIASREDLIRAVKDLPAASRADSVARRIPTLRPETPLAEAVEMTRRLAEPVLPVVNLSSQIVGLFSLAYLQENAAPQGSV